jgi:hypothetical protein
MMDSFTSRGDAFRGSTNEVGAIRQVELRRSGSCNTIVYRVNNSSFSTGRRRRPQAPDGGPGSSSRCGHGIACLGIQDCVTIPSGGEGP